MSVISLQVTVRLVRVYNKTDVDQEVQKKAQECFKEWCNEEYLTDFSAEPGKSSCAVIFAIM